MTESCYLTNWHKLLMFIMCTKMNYIKLSAQTRIPIVLPHAHTTVVPKVLHVVVLCPGGYMSE